MHFGKAILIVSIIIVGILLLCGILLSPNNQLAETATKNNASDNKMVTVYVLTSKVTSDGERHSYTYDKNGNIIITVDGYTFKPDLSFMNDHAVCKYCGLIYTWDYE